MPYRRTDEEVKAIKQEDKKSSQRRQEGFERKGQQGDRETPNLNMLQAFLQAMGLLPESRTEPIFGTTATNPQILNYGDQTKEAGYAGFPYASDTYRDPRWNRKFPSNPADATNALMAQEREFNPGFPAPKPTGLEFKGKLDALGAPLYNQLYPIDPREREVMRPPPAAMNQGPAAPAPNPTGQGPNPAQIIQLLQQLGLQGFAQ